MPLIKPWYLYSFAVETADSSILQTVINFIMHILLTELLNMDILTLYERDGASVRDDTLCSPYHPMLICDVTSTPMTAERKQVQAISLFCRRLSPRDGMRHMYVT